MNLTPLSEHIGALVEGVDLSNLSEQEFDALYQAYLKHKVLFFRDQGMTPQQQIGWQNVLVTWSRYTRFFLT